MALERFWTQFAPVLSVIAAFAAFSWFGGFMYLQPLARPVVVAAFAALLLYSLWRLRRVDTVSEQSAAGRLDRESGIAHRPAASERDTLGMAADDPVTVALWQAHKNRNAEKLDALKVGGPRPEIAKRDPWALRVAALVAAVAAFFVAGPEWRPRLAVALQWTTPAPPPVPPRIDVWVTPPAYTGRPPIFLVRSDRQANAPLQPADPASEPATGEPAEAPKPPVAIPAGSALIIRASPAEGIATTVEGGLVAKETAQAAAPTGQPVAVSAQTANRPFEQRFEITSDGRISVTQDGNELEAFRFTVQPDQAPTVEFVQVARQEKGEGLVLRYRANDDYGLVNGNAVLTPRLDGDGNALRTLVPAPEIKLALPRGRRGSDQETRLALPDHPWAGQRLDAKLVVSDDTGARAESATRPLTIPQRVFTNAVSKSLVELRRWLVFNPDDPSKVLMSLNALQTGADFFKVSAADYISLRMLSTQLKRASSDAELVAITEGLWQLALSMENALSAAERRLRAAEQALKEALERGASPEEIARLTQELRQAMNEYMREFAQNNQRNQQSQQRERNQNERMLSERDMQDMLKEIERLSREGKTEEAQRLLEQLQQAMRNLQMAEGQGQQQSGQNDMRRQRNELDRLTRDQQQLRDRTHREGQRRQRREQGGQDGQQEGDQNGEQQQGQQGQGQQGQGQQGQQGQGQQGQGEQGQGEQGQGEQGQGQGQNGQGGQGQQGGNGLGERQGQLRDRLGNLQRGMRQNGLADEPGFGDAEQAMRDAEDALGRGDEQGAADAQGRALEGLRRGAQGLAQQMQQQGDQQQAGEEGDGSEQATGDDEPGRPGNPEGQANSDDPLGRPTRSRDWTSGNAKVPEATAAERAARVLQELREKLGDFKRPQLELDYFERLLPRN
jgi:uncharacterized protein (TIGR02302 family)